MEPRQEEGAGKIVYSDAAARPSLGPQATNQSGDSRSSDEKKQADVTSRATANDEEAAIGFADHAGDGGRDGDVVSVAVSSASSDKPTPRYIVFLKRHRSLLRAGFYTLLVLLMTGWWIAGLVMHRKDRGWVVPFLVWLALSLRILTLYVSLRRPVQLLLWPLQQAWTLATQSSVGQKVQNGRFQQLPLVCLTVAVILVGTFASPETADNTRANRAISLVGLVIFMGSFYLTSRDRKRINYRAVFGGLLAQFLLGLFVLRTGVGYTIFNFVGYLAKTLLEFAGDGTSFLTSTDVLSAGWFLISVIPAIIFFVAFVQLLYYWGWIQWLVGHFASIFFYLLGISGAEAVVAAASPFIGQGESAVLIRAYMSRLTRAEIHQVMTSGFATIAGSVLSAYISMGVSPLALISSCVMSIPASIALSKLRYPETEEPVTAGHTAAMGDDDDLDQYDVEEKPFNSLHALANGSWLGIKIGGMVCASVLCILALLGLVNGLLGWWGGYLNVPQLSVQLIVGYLLYPVAFLLGVDSKKSGDIYKVAQLIGIKIVANEFVAYGDLTTNPEYATLSPRSQFIAMYALCGFGNFSAVGIQIGALSQLAPRRAGDVARVAVSALITGIVATLTSANIAGMLMRDENNVVQVAST